VSPGVKEVVAIVVSSHLAKGFVHAFVTAILFNMTSTGSSGLYLLAITLTLLYPAGNIVV